MNSIVISPAQLSKYLSATYNHTKSSLYLPRRDFQATCLLPSSMDTPGNFLRGSEIFFFEAQDGSQIMARIKKSNTQPLQLNPKKFFSNATLFSKKISPRKNNRLEKLRAIADRLLFFFSDANLCHDDYARPILEQHSNKYLPLDVIMTFKSIQRWSRDPRVIMEAVDLVNANPEGIKLQLKEVERGKVLIGRIEPYNHEEILRKSKLKTIVIMGWPIKKNNRALARFRSILFGEENTEENVNVAFWGHDIPKGTITIEFDTEDGVAQAMKNLEYFADEAINSGCENDVHILEIEGIPLTVQRRAIPERSNSSSAEQNSKDIQTLHKVKKYQQNLNGISLTRNDFDLSPLFQRGENEFAGTSSITPTIVDSLPDIDESDWNNSWWSDGTAKPGLMECKLAIIELFKERSALPPPPREWLHEYTPRSNKFMQHEKLLQQYHVRRRYKLCKEVAALVQCVKNAIAEGNITALGSQDGYMISDFLAQALLVYSESPPRPSTHHLKACRSEDNDDYHSNQLVDDISEKDVISPYYACIEVFHILNELNLDIHPSHYAFAIRAACHEYRWEEAADLFLAQIGGIASDDDDQDNSRYRYNRSNLLAPGGFVPIDPTLGWDQPLQLGLYAVARNERSKMTLGRESAVGVSNPSKIVFETALRMCMMSPSNKENYVLAAGAALGRAGLWSDCLDFATSQENVISYGPSIAAAAMLACIESSRPIEALHAYEFFRSGNQETASEWQWAGGSMTAAKSTCRDLALNAMGGIYRGGCGDDARRFLCEIIDEDSPLSRNALLGVMRSFEYDGLWEASIDLLHAFVHSVYLPSIPKWRFVRDTMGLSSDYTETEAVLSKQEREELLAEMLTSTMRACNRSGHFGLAILQCNILDSTYFNKDAFPSKEDCITSTILSQGLIKNRSVFECYSHSLRKLGCGRITELLTRKLSQDWNSIKDRNPRLDTKYMRISDSWCSAMIAMNRIIETCLLIRRGNESTSSESLILVERGLFRAMSHCLDSKQSTAALHLFKYAAKALKHKEQESFTKRVLNFLGGDRRSREKPSDIIFETTDYMDLAKQLGDSVNSVLIDSYNTSGKMEGARIHFFESKEDCSRVMVQSSNSIMTSFLQSDDFEWTDFLDKLSAECLTPSTFLTIARHFSDIGDCQQVGEIYNKARSAGCVSEELGLIAMKAVNESEISKGKMTILRKIVRDVSNLVGMSETDWISSNYWNIKGYVGFHHARLLMKWNDPKTSQKEELLLAVSEMRKCVKKGILTKNAPLHCIVKQGQLFSAVGEFPISERQAMAAINLILEACVEADRSGLFNDYTFTAEVAKSLRGLRGNKQCISIAKALISRKLKHKVAVEEGIHAASEERDDDAFQLFVNFYEKSGYNSSDLLRASS